jgi:phosphomannomutase
MDIHIDEVLNLPLVDAELVAKRKFKVVVDGVNSSGGIIIPKLLEQMGVECVKLFCEPNGHFPHNPEPLKEHLGAICKLVLEEEADFGIVVDPDVDRLAFISNDGEMFGEEYTLVAVADYVLSNFSFQELLLSNDILEDIADKLESAIENNTENKINLDFLKKFRTV